MLYSPHHAFDRIEKRTAVKFKWRQFTIGLKRLFLNKDFPATSLTSFDTEKVPIFLGNFFAFLWVNSLGDFFIGRLPLFHPLQGRNARNTCNSSSPYSNDFR